jgi:hypothetical protein
MAEDGNVVHEYEPHAQSYDGFIKLTVATTLAVLFVLVGLLAVGFAQSFSVLVGVVGIVVGLATVTITLMTGGNNWLPATVLLILYFLLTATLL